MQNYTQTKKGPTYAKLSPSVFGKEETQKKTHSWGFEPHSFGKQGHINLDRS
jgi:hypothetical protein